MLDASVDYISNYLDVVSKLKGGFTIADSSEYTTSYVT